MTKKLKIFVFIFFLSLPLLAKSANFGDVVINEIAWAGTINSANDEWIELYNTTNFPINLDNWALKSDDGSPSIKLKGILQGNEFYLLERTDDNTVSGVKADLIYKGAMENTGENLKLFNSSQNLIDEVNCQTKWFAGESSSKKTMSKIDSAVSGNIAGNWENSQNANGTPKEKNNFSEKEPPKEIIETPKQTIVATEDKITVVATSKPEKTIICPTRIIFNEILPSPKGADEENEWIEILNKNDNISDLSGLIIKDLEGQTISFIFPENSKIESQKYLILKRETTKITLNNSTDGLNLLCGDATIDSVLYQNAKTGQSYNRVNEDWRWSDLPTPEKENIIKLATASIKNSTSQKAKISGSQSYNLQFDNFEKQTANVSDKTNFFGKNIFPFAIAFAIAIFSSAVIFFLKKGVKKEVQ